MGGLAGDSAFAAAKEAAIYARMTHFSKAESAPAAPTFHVPMTIRRKSEVETRGIVNAIRQSLADGALGPGDRLPPEKVLCEQYSASRYTVRKAMSELETAGIVVRKVGRGSFIQAPPAPARHAAPAEGVGRRGEPWSLFDLTEARLLIEPPVAELVIERADPGDYRAMRRCLEAIDNARDWPSFKEAKYAFHLAIIRAARNEFLNFVFEQIIASRRNSAWNRPGATQTAVDGVKAICLAESRAIVETLEARDAEAAADAIRCSLFRVLAAITA